MTVLLADHFEHKRQHRAWRLPVARVNTRRLGALPVARVGRSAVGRSRIGPPTIGACPVGRSALGRRLILIGRRTASYIVCRIDRDGRPQYFPTLINKTKFPYSYRARWELWDFVPFIYIRKRGPLGVLFFPFIGL